MADSHTEHRARRFATGFDPEMVAYALFGLLVVGLGARAFAAWLLNAWANGERLLPLSALCSVVAGAVGVLVLVRHRKRILYLGVALVAVGVVAFLLASAGFTLPRSWLE